MIIKYDDEIYKLNDTFGDYEFKVICDTDDLISICNLLDSRVKKYYYGDIQNKKYVFSRVKKYYYEDILNKKYIFLSVSKKNLLIACMVVKISDNYVENSYGYENEIMNYEDLLAIEDWGVTKNLKFCITQREIEELLRG